MECENYLPHYLQFISEFQLPYLELPHEYRYITVTSRGRVGDDRWTIKDGAYCYNQVLEEWEYEMRPSEREDEWMDQTRMTLEEALPLAKRLCAQLKARAIHRISRILVIRVRQARQNDDPRLEEYRRNLAEWQAERKQLEVQ